MEFHKYAKLFPMMSDDELNSLREDIKNNGLLEPIILLNDEILDGRNRYTACELEGISPIYEDYSSDIDPLTFVLSKNLERRHLTSSQKATLAVELLPIYEEQAKERMKKGVHNPMENLPQGTSRDLVGKQLGISGRYVSEAKKLLNECPEDFKAVKSGEKTFQDIKKEKRKADIEQLKEV